MRTGDDQGGGRPMMPTRLGRAAATLATTVTPAALPSAAVGTEVERLARAGATFVFNLSGGKDSTAAAVLASRVLDALGHPRSHRIAVHADLGRAEWRSTQAFVERIANLLGVELLVVRRRAGDLFQRFEQRWRGALQRYAALETYTLIGPWSSPSLRFCQSELKTTVIGPAVARRFAGAFIISVLGLRRDESGARAGTAVFAPDHRFAGPENRSGTRMFTWNPVADWTAHDVFAAHQRWNMPLHEAYATYGSSRLSCAFCIMGSLHDLDAAARADDNLDAYRFLVNLEAASAFSYQPARWLADIRPNLLGPELLRAVDGARLRANARRQSEARLPAGLRYVRGWPPRIPSLNEAATIADVRAQLLADHDLPDRYPTPTAVRDRFAALHADAGRRRRGTVAP